jgi:hypothetical protein
MGSWITIAAVFSAFSAVYLRIAAFAMFCLTVAAVFLIIGIATGSKISTAIAWTLLLIGGMQVGYLAGVLGLSVIYYVASRKEQRFVL